MVCLDKFDEGKSAKGTMKKFLKIILTSIISLHLATFITEITVFLPKAFGF